MIAAAASLAALAASALAASAPTALTVTINATAVVAHTAPEYISFNFDFHTDDEEYPAWVNSSILNMSLIADPDLTFLAAQLAPAHIRIGGSEGDLVVYETTPGAGCPADTQFCLTLDRWDEINRWAKATTTTIAFGLNAMAGRANASSPWDASNALAFLTLTAAKENYTNLFGFEYGNELEDKVKAPVYAVGVQQLRSMIDELWASVPAASRPALIANDENPDNSYWSELLSAAAAAMSAASWHLYVGYGLDPWLPADSWNRTFLDKIAGTAAGQINAAAPFKGLPLWIGETAMAWHSGRNGTTNTFLSGPWWLAQLGTLAATHAVQCRQTLKGGNYELIDKWTMLPNPDWWSALLWKRTVGTGVLRAAAASQDVLVYAHCTTAASAPGSGSGGSSGAQPWRARAAGTSSAGAGVTLVFVNLSPDTTFAVDVAGVGAAAVPREEYHLTPPAGDEASQRVLLNGAELVYYRGQGKLSPVDPVVVTDPAQPLLLAPHSYGFVVFPDAANPC